jgi:hypothetical protein
MSERFTLLSELGRGGMGIVWLARDEETGNTVALKLLRDIYADDADYRLRFEHELAIASRITSQHVVKVLGYGARDGAPYIAFEYVDGPSLRALLSEHGPYTWTEVRALLLQLAEGLADAHATGVIHRDVKPANVLVDRTGMAKLADFGISRAIDITRVTGTSGLVGTPAYLAPEGPADARSDLYSLGVLAYEMLTGNQPFEGRSYQDVLVAHLRTPPDLSRVPAECRRIVGWLLEKDPADRPQTARQLIRVLLGEEAVPSPAAARPPSATRTALAPQSPADWNAIRFASGQNSRRNGQTRLLAGVGGVAAVAAIVGLVVVPGLYGSRAATPAPISSSRAADATDLAVETVADGVPPGPTATPAGGSALVEPTATPPQSPTGQWLGLGTVSEGPLGDTLYQLPNGKAILFSTAVNGTHAASGNSWLLDPNTGAVTPWSKMGFAQTLPSSARLSDGSIVVVGGWSGPNPIRSAEIFDAASASWVALTPMNTPRSQAIVSEISGGRILVAGGWVSHNADGGWTATNSVEIYDRATGSWSFGPSMATPRALAGATRMADGRILVTGGDQAWVGSTGEQALSSAEAFDPANNTWHSAGSMSEARATPVAALLPNGHVLVAGGWQNGGEKGSASADEYDPAVGWSPVAPMPAAHAQGRTATLADGRIMVIGGVDGSGEATSDVELFNPATGTWTHTGNLEGPVYWPAAVVLADGRVLVAGGLMSNSQVSRNLQIFTPPPA